MRRAALVILLFSLGGCARQDAAMLVTFAGQWRIPQDGDTLAVAVIDTATTQQIKSASYPLTSLPVTLTLVQSGAAHPRVRVRATLQVTKGSTPGTTALGSAEADFQGGQTVNVTVTLVPPQ